MNKHWADPVDRASLRTGVGPAYAVPHLFKRFGITKDDVDIYELNEGAFSISRVLNQVTSPTHSALQPSLRNPSW